MSRIQIPKALSELNLNFLNLLKYLEMCFTQSIQIEKAKVLDLLNYICKQLETTSILQTLNFDDKSIMQMFHKLEQQ